MSTCFISGGRYVIRWYGRRLAVTVAKVRFDGSAIAVVDGKLTTIWPESIVRSV